MTVRQAIRTYGLLAVALLALKIGYLLDYSALPFIRGPIFDSLIYVRQATAIHAGQFTDATLIACGPLYGWFLALWWGPSLPGLAVVSQLVLGFVALGLIVAVAHRRFGARAGLVAFGLYAGYGVLLAHESKILSETLALALLAGALACFFSARFERGALGVAVGCGVLLALSVLTRISLVFSAPLFVLAALASWSREESTASSWRARARRALGMAIGMSLVFGANGTWNSIQFGRFVPIVLVGPRLSYVSASSHAGAWHGTFSFFSEDGTGHVSPFDMVRNVEVALGRRAAPPIPPGTHLRDGVDVAGYVAGAPSKIFATLQDTEATFVEYGYYGERSEVRALGALPVSFGAILLLAVIGAAGLVRRRGWQALTPYLPVILGVLAATTLFYPSSRYRLPVVLPLILLASAAPEALALITQPTWRRIAVVLTSLACAAFAVRLYTYRLSRPSFWHLRVAESALSARDVPEARRRIALALASARRTHTLRSTQNRIHLVADPWLIQLGEAPYFPNGPPGAPPDAAQAPASPPRQPHAQ